MGMRKVELDSWSNSCSGDEVDEASTFSPCPAAACKWVVVRKLGDPLALFLVVPHLLPASRVTTTTTSSLTTRTARNHMAIASRGVMVEVVPKRCASNTSTIKQG